mgnify:CR=1 FL=1
MREPGVFDRFRFAPADDRSRELKGGDGARGDCGLGTAATKAASFEDDRAGGGRGIVGDAGTASRKACLLYTSDAADE